MYQLQESPDEEAILEDGSVVKPIATLADGCGGRSHIIIDDNCYVLINGRNFAAGFSMTHHWYKEAAEALKSLL